MTGRECMRADMGWTSASRKPLHEMRESPAFALQDQTVMRKLFCAAVTASLRCSCAGPFRIWMPFVLLSISCELG